MGGVMVAPRDAGEMDVMQAIGEEMCKIQYPNHLCTLATVFLTVNSKDLWVGVRSKREMRVFSPFEIQPFILETINEKGYANGDTYTPEVDYNFDLSSKDRWEGPCVYLKGGGGGYAAEETDKCLSSKSFICEWNGIKQFKLIQNSTISSTFCSGPVCPQYYYHLGHYSDSRTCHGDPPGEVKVTEEMCDEPLVDKLRGPLVPLTQDILASMREHL